MKHATIILIALTILLTGCSEIRYAQANDIRAKTKRDNDMHAQTMADSRALAPARIAAKEISIWVLTGSLSISVIALTLAGCYYVVGVAIHKVRHSAIQQIYMDHATRQFPLLIYRNNRAIQLNTGDRYLLDQDWLADQDRIKAATRVQITGLLSNGMEAPKVIKLLRGEK